MVSGEAYAEGMETSQSNYLGDRADLDNVRGYVNAECHACNGTGEDAAFGGECAECAHQNRQDLLLKARYAGVTTGRADRVHTPGERMDGRTWGSTSNDDAASGKQLDYLSSLLSKCADKDFAATCEEGVANGVTKKQASKMIDSLVKLVKHESAEKPSTGRSNRYPGACTKCGGTVEADAGLLTKSDNGKWLTTHADGDCASAQQTDTPDAAESHTDTSYEAQRGHVHALDGELYRVHIAQRSGQPYLVRGVIVRAAVWEDGEVVEAGTVDWDYDSARGKIKRCSEDTLATAEQSKEFGHMAGRCVYCSKAIDTAESTDAGYGPSCAAKYGLPWG